MKNILKIIAIALMAMMLFGCTSAPKREAGVEYKLTILHTNDHHGAVLANDDGEGGLAERATFVKQVRAENENILLLDAGDINTGAALSNMFSGEVDIKAYNLLGYDAVTFGNHEFDGTHEKVLNQIAMADFDWISANIKDGKDYLDQAYVVKDFDGFRVGIFGLTTMRAQVIASPDESLTFIDEIEASKEMVDVLRNKEKVDIVIAVGHVGSYVEEEGHNTSSIICEAVDGIDIFVDGHSHTYFDEPEVVNGAQIVSANEWGKVVGQMDVTIVDGKITKSSWKPVAITSEAFPPDAEMVAFIKPYADEANASLQDVVMVTSEEFDAGDKLNRKKEMPHGNLVSDAQVAFIESEIGVKVDFGFTNGGNIRASLPKGDVTKENILTMLPFENYIYVLDLKGTDVVELFEFIGKRPQGSGAFAQVSKEVSYTITNPGENGVISNVLINGEPIDESKTYKIAVNNYIAGGGDGYEVLTRATSVFNTSMLMSDMTIWYANTLPQPIAPETHGRITVVGGLEL